MTANARASGRNRRDVVPLVALIALMVVPAFTLVTECPVPPWRDEGLLEL